MDPLGHAQTDKDGRVDESHDKDVDKKPDVGKLNIARLVIMNMAFLSVVS